MSKSKVLSMLVGVVTLTTLTYAAKAEVRPVQVHRVEQLTRDNVELKYHATHDDIRRNVHKTFTKEDAAKLESKIETKDAGLTIGLRTPRAWRDLYKQFLALERTPRHVLGDDSDPGGFY